MSGGSLDFCEAFVRELHAEHAKHRLRRLRATVSHPWAVRLVESRRRDFEHLRRDGLWPGQMDADVERWKAEDEAWTADSLRRIESDEYLGRLLDVDLYPKRDQVEDFRFEVEP